MRLSILLVVLVVCASLGVIPQPVSADDEWPDDDCSDAPLISSGTHSGTLTPGDFDLMRVDIPDGEYVEIEMTRSDDVLIELYQMTDSGYGGYQDVSVSGEAYFDGYDNIEVDFEESGDDNTATFRVYHEEDGEVCLPLTTQGESGPTDWEMSLSRGGSSDEWADEAEEATTISSGTHSGTLTPGDFDLMRVDIPDGEYVEIEMTRSDDVLIELYQMTDSGYGGYQDVSVSGEAYFDGYDNIEVDFEESGDDNTATFRVYHEEDGEVYLPLTTQGSSGPADWSIQIAKNQPVDTPTPTPTATPTPTPTPTATPTPTPTPTATPTPTPTPTATDSAGDSTPSPTDDSGGSGDDIQDSDGDGVIDSEDYAPNDPEVQEKSDLQGTSGGAVPGFGVGIAIVALLIGTLVVLRRSD